MNTYIDDKKTIPIILNNGWTIKNNNWTNCPESIYNQIKKEL